MALIANLAVAALIGAAAAVLRVSLHIDASITTLVVRASTAASAAFGESRTLTAASTTICWVVAKHVGAFVFMVATTAETKRRIAIAAAALVVGRIEGVLADWAGDGGEVEVGGEDAGTECLDSTGQHGL